MDLWSLRWNCGHQDHQLNRCQYNPLNFHYHQNNNESSMCPFNVEKNYLCSFPNNLMCFLHELGNQPKCIGDIRMSMSQVQ